MKVCPGCQRSTKISERIEVDKKSKKSWLITFCAKCGYNYELEQYLGEVLSPEEEIDIIKWPEKKKWPYI